MSPATREKLIVMLFPAAMVALAWWGWFRPTRQLATLQKSAAMTIGNEDPNAIRRAQSRANGLAVEVQHLDNQRNMYLARWQELCAKYQHNDSRPQILENLAKVFHRYDITILHERPIAPPTNALPKLSGLRRNLTPPLVGLPDEPETGSSAMAGVIDSIARRSGWEIEFVGEYADVQAALRHLANQGNQLVPVSLQMARTDATLKLRLWTLVVVL